MRYIRLHTMLSAPIHIRRRRAVQFGCGQRVRRAPGHRVGVQPSVLAVWYAHFDTHGGKFTHTHTHTHKHTTHTALVSYSHTSGSPGQAPSSGTSYDVQV